MKKDHFAQYIDYITPTKGDPTYSILRAHLLFEELLRAYLKNVLPHPGALEDARLTFSQILCIARSVNTQIEPDFWTWKAISDLNKIRNLLAHNARPKSLGEKINAYVSFVVKNTGKPLPKQAERVGDAKTGSTEEVRFLAVDLATTGLYYFAAGTMSFDVISLLDEE